MKTKILSIILCAAALTACSNVDDTFELSDDITVSSLQTRDTMLVVPTDTVRLKFLVSTNRGSIRNLQLEVDESVVERVPEKTRFALIDENDSLSVDADGNLSRDVSTVVVEYPVVVKDNPDVLKSTFKATLVATNAAGRSATNYTHFRGSNIRTKKDITFRNSLWLFGNTPIFFSASTFKAYSASNLTVWPVGDEESTKDSIKVSEAIDMVIAYRYDMYNPARTDTYRLMSPDSEETEAFVHNELKQTGVQTRGLRHCELFRIEGVGGASLDEEIANEMDFTKKYLLMMEREKLDLKFFDDNVDDEYIAALDFTNAKTFLEARGGLYAFKTQEGRKGVIWIDYFSAFGYLPSITIKRFAVQAISVE